MKKVLVIDNYDSFVYNVIQLLREAVVPVGYDIVRNDKIDFFWLRGLWRDSFVARTGYSGRSRGTVKTDRIL